ncbi:MAG: hypothetical protein ACLFPA_07525 [Dichotomicrobium sp.]
MEHVLEQSLARLPKARLVVCVSLDTGFVLGHSQTAYETEAPDPEALGRSAVGLFQDIRFPPDDVPEAGDGLNEALVAGPDLATIFLRCQNREAAVAYAVARDSDLGLALATSRLTLPEIEAEI